MNRIEQYLTSLWYRQQLQLIDWLALALLWLPSALYGLILRLRAWCYTAGICTTHRLPRPVISIGNITVGGTGKTPVTAHIARKLINQGLKVCVISRGYGGSREGTTTLVSDGTTIFETPEACGDEPYLLASSIPGLAVVIGSNRYQAGLLAMEKLQPDVFLLDDGFQHLRLHRDLNILLLDANLPYGNGYILPAGPLREPRTATRRADLRIFTRSSNATGEHASHVTPTCSARYLLTRFQRVDTGQEIPLSILQHTNLLAVAGIAKPESFFSSLQEVGITPLQTLALADHQAYNQTTVTTITQVAAPPAITWIITTEKDAVKLAETELFRHFIVVLASLKLEIQDENLLNETLEQAIQRTTPHE